LLRVVQGCYVFLLLAVLAPTPDVTDLFVSEADSASLENPHGVLPILQAGGPLQVGLVVVRLDAVLVVDFTPERGSVKRDSDQDVNQEPAWFPASAQVHRQVGSVAVLFELPAWNGTVATAGYAPDLPAFGHFVESLVPGDRLPAHRRVRTADRGTIQIIFARA
jgi:hypothetical protein